MDQKIDDAVIAKIQKLLALATSGNEHEAKSAATKAQELLVKYNLDLQQVKSKDFEYEEVKVASEPYLRWHQPFIIDIIEEFFFVKVFWYNVAVGLAWRDPGKYRGDATKYRKDICLVGTKTNVKVAHYVFDYLSQVYQRLWLEYKRENKLTEKSRKSYYQGLTSGLCVKLATIRKQVQDEKGLVLVADPALEEKTKNIKKHSNPYQPEQDIMAELAGHEHGKEIQIAKPIDSKAEHTGLALSGKKGKKNEEG